MIPTSLTIHDAIIVATALVYKNILKLPVEIVTEDTEIKTSVLFPLAGEERARRHTSYSFDQSYFESGFAAAFAKSPAFTIVNFAGSM